MKFMIKCKFCNNPMKQKINLGWLCSNHKDILVIYVGNFAIIKDEFEILIGNNITQLNYHKKQNGTFCYFDEPQTIFSIPQILDVTPENFDEYIERFKKMVPFS